MEHFDDGDDISRSLRGQAAKYAIKSMTSKENEDEISTLLMLTLAGLLMFIGADIVKIIFRKNFGLTREGTIRLIITFLTLAGVSIAAFNFSVDKSEAEKIGNPDVSFIFGILYACLAFYTLYYGIKQRIQSTKGSINEKSIGQSYLLNFLSKENWSEKKIYYLAEPMCTLALGIFITCFNLIGGIPIIICALSVWIHALLLELFSGIRNNKQTATQLNAGLNEAVTFHDLRIDF